jgi:membrane protein YdbS with pleckstrin-like domain
MKCAKCGNNLADDAAFCSKCGAPVGGAADADDDGGAMDAPAVARVQASARQRGAAAANSPVEQDLWSGTFSPRAMIGPAIGCGVLSVALIVVGAITANPIVWLAVIGVMILVWAWLGLTIMYRRLTVRYRLTNYRFFHDVGLLTRTANRVEVIDIDDVTVRQGLIERMFNTGTIHIDCPTDSTHPDLDLPGIDDPRAVADLIDSTRRTERQRRGLHIEAI